MRNSKIVLLALLSAIMLNVYPQISCEIIGDTITLVRSEETNKYIPDAFTPIKTIKINFHFMLKSDSTLNFRPYDDGLGDCSFTAYDYSNEIIRLMNLRLSVNEHMHLPQNNNTEVLPRQYRVNLKGVYFHYDDNAYTFSSSSPGYLSETEINQYSINAGSEVNVFFVYEDDPNGNDGGNANMIGNRYIRKKQSWQKYVQYGNVGFWADAFLLAHELGHNLGLLHTMLTNNGYCCNTCDDGFDDTPTRIEIINAGQPDPCPSFGDEGIYYSNNMMDYSGLMAITPEQLGMVHYTLTHSMFPYIEDDYCSVNGTEPEYVLASGLNLTWQNDRILKNNLTIENGAKLTLKNCVLHIPNGAKIVVKPGGELIVDGATITNKCGLMWQGIEVWGNSSMHQYEMNGSYGQGYLELKNGAVIENAVCAVELWRPGYYSTTGGIVHATNATFRNNGIAVHALCYTNYDPGMDVRRSYNAYFKGCSFATDNAYIGTTPFLRHVDLALVDGIDFFGCDFSVLRHAPGVSYSCSGIQANQASFNVNSYCTDETVLPCLDEYLLRSSFSGFHQGICAFNNGNTACVFNVRNSDFLNNDQGIYAQNTGYATILFNNFSIGCGAECTYGIYADNVTGFCIEENTFVPWNNSGCPAYGIAVINSHSTNAIYRNQFSGLVCANVAVGLNVGIANNAIPLTSTGLTYSCNDNTSGSANTIDFCVLRDGNVFYSGIQQAQGSMLLPAGNTFGGSQYHFYNEGNHTINYYYNQNQSDETPAMSKISGVSLSGTSAANSCPSHYGNDVARSPQEKEELASEYLAAHSAYNSLRQVYESRIDGGSTPTELSDITNATPSDMWELRAQLLGHSPYLSQEVLTAAADRDDVFTDPVLFEILSANPDELKKDTLISYLESKDNPLPEYMIEVLRQVANGATARTALEAQMAKYSHDFRLAAGDIVRSNLNDSVSNPVELRTWLAAMEDIAADRLAVASYMEVGNYTDAFTLANMLPDLYGLEGDALADHTDYMRLLSLYRTLGASGRTVFEMTDDEIETVEGIADEGLGNSKSMAEALLVGIDGRSVTSFCPELPIPKRGNRNGNVNTEVLMNEAMGFTVSVSPSPATTWTKVDYTLPAGADKALLTLTSTLGVKVMDMELGGSQGSKVLDLRGLAAGVYAYSIRCGGHVETGKLVITK